MKLMNHVAGKFRIAGANQAKLAALLQITVVFTANSESLAAAPRSSLFFLRWREAAAWIGIGLIGRTVLAMLVPLLPDETYYWEWTRRLEAGYFDHPPGIALLIAAGTSIFGNNVLGVRSGPALAALVTHWCVTVIAARLGGPRAAARAACLTALLPLATLGLILATPDALLMATAAMTLVFVERALSATPRSRASLWWWTLAGAAVGVALVSKYTAILLPLSFFVGCLVYFPLRQRLSELGPWLAATLALLLFLPVVVWNAQHDWISFRFQLGHGFGAAARGNLLGRELELVGGQLALATPIFGVMLFMAVVTVMRREWRMRYHVMPTSQSILRFAFSMTALVPVALFSLSALRRPIEPNWLALFYPAAIALLASTQLPWAHGRWWKAGLIVAVVFQLTFVAQVWQPIVPVAPRRDPIARAHGWTTLASAVERARHDPFFDGITSRWVAADRYQDASELAFHLPDQPTVFSLNLGGRRNQYDLWPTLYDLVKAGDALVVTFDVTTHGDSLAGVVATWFAESRRGETIALRRNSGVVRQRRLWLYRGARAVPAPGRRLPEDATPR